jgi:DNA polymerase III subunit delta
MSSDFPQIALFLGDESVGRKRAESTLVDAVFCGASPSFNLATFTAADGAERAIEVARTVPMMAKHRVVVVREMESASVPLLDALLKYAEKPNPSTVLILTGLKTSPATGGVDRGRRLEGAVKRLETGRVERFKTGEQDPVRFAVATAAEAGCTIGHRAASLLVELVGSDLGRIQTELGKVVAYVGGSGEIDGAAIEAVCSLVAEAAIWDLTDAVVRRDPDRALAIAHRMLDTGESSHRLIAMIAWQMRQLITLQDCMRRSISPRDAGIRMPRRKLEAATAAIRSRPIPVARMLDQIASANADLNRSRAGDRRVFEGLLLQLTT